MEGLTRMRRTSEHLTMMEVVGQDGATDWEHLRRSNLEPPNQYKLPVTPV